MNKAELTFVEETPGDSVYVLVLWPWVQDLMEYTWFRKECLLHNASDDQEYHDSAYFVPIKRMLEVQVGDISNYMGD
ncbi:hypothetical protein ABIB62_003773 [Mucilaginibacter sp. UYP25]|uniref:hypothetical protein n=1 Tax=unclassified Mucilaginibacter TaxID=2617802 RepID=UPI00339ADE44